MEPFCFTRSEMLMAVMLGVLLLTVPAQAQSRCGERADLVRMLEQQYHERQVGVGMGDAGGLMEIFARDDGRTWTALVTRPSGIACIVMTGTDWEAVRERTVRGL